MNTPFRPEPIADLKARYPAALERVYNSYDIAFKNAERPGQSRSQVFDYNENNYGLRFIISREYNKEQGMVTHFSATMAEDSAILASAKMGLLTLEVFLSTAVTVFQEISGDFREYRLVGLSPGEGVPHWVIDEDQASDGSTVPLA